METRPPDRDRLPASVPSRPGPQSAGTVACGDGENDRELLDWAAYKVAVANAHLDILGRADLVVPDVEHEGIADLFEAFVHSLQ